MRPVITDVKGTILQMLKEQNKTVEELADYTGIKADVLKNKLSTGYYMNKFTVSQLQEIADFFDCSLSLDFVSDIDNKIYHCKTIDEVIEEGINNIPTIFSNNINI